MKLVRWIVLALAMAAAGAFVAQLLRPRPIAGVGSGYRPPTSAEDQYVVLPKR